LRRERPADGVGRAFAVDADERLAALVVLDDGHGVVLEHVQALADRLLGVVVALDQLAATVVADARVVGLVVLDVIVRATLRADPATGQAVDQFLLRGVEVKHDVEVGDLREVLGLREVAGVAVQHVAVGLPKGGLDDFVDDLVGHEFARFHVRAGRVVLGVEMPDIHVFVRA
jgi:hypothetical protein